MGQHAQGENGNTHRPLFWRYSTLLIPTQREEPGDAEIISHRLMLRAGMIRKVSSGIYTLLPLGYRVLRRIERIVREEMDRAGAQELLMPMVQPAELWEETGRWQQYGKELLRFKDRHARNFCLGPTHEELITDLVRRDVRSYRQLPLNLYQIQMKFRDEIRPRFGIMRGREFLMKDAYSFDLDEEGAQQSYQRMYDAYQRIFTRCGLRFRAVQADTGLIGGSSSHEFMVLAETGEEVIVSCDACDYAANLEQAKVSERHRDAGGRSLNHQRNDDSVEEVNTPGRKCVSDVAEFLGIAPSQLIKTLIYEADGQPVAVLIRGDHEANDVKLRRFLNAQEVLLARTEVVERVTGGPSGYSGPVGLKIPIVADQAIEGQGDFVVGGNVADLHLRHATPGRDFQIERFGDIRAARAGDPCPQCAGRLQTSRGIEVGHVFMLGDKYSSAMQATVLDKSGRSRPMVMGCYGIGVSRTIAAAIEQHHDEKGIIWPVPLAPFHLYLIPLNMKDQSIREVVTRLADHCASRGYDVLLDDRDERAGIKFNDADLIGIPVQIVVGGRAMKEGFIEVKRRVDGETARVREADLPGLLSGWLGPGMAAA